MHDEASPNRFCATASGGGDSVIVSAGVTAVLESIDHCEVPDVGD